MAKELHLYLKHLQIEPDRNEGNINLDQNTIHHLDFKALRIKPWMEESIREIAPLLVNLIKIAANSNKPLDQVFSELLKQKGDFKPETKELISEIETGIMSLTPYLEKITKDDLIQIAIAVLEKGIHPLLADEIVKEVPLFLRGIVKNVLSGQLSSSWSVLKPILASAGINDLDKQRGKVKLL